MRRLFFHFVIFVVFLGFNMSFAAADDESMRHAVFRIKKPLKIIGKGKSACKTYRDSEFSFHFNEKGGKVKKLVDRNKAGYYGKYSGGQVCGELSRAGELLDGYFEGGDGGKIWMKIKRNDLIKGKSKTIAVTGNLFGKGYGDLKIGNSDKLVRVKFDPFGTCNPDLDIYTEKARSVILSKLLATGGEAVYGTFKKSVDESWKYFVKKVHLWEYAADQYDYRIVGLTEKMRTLPKTFYQRMAKDFIPDTAKNLPAMNLLNGLLTNITTAVGFMEATDSALHGEYTKAGFKTAVEAIGLYSNSLGLFIVVGEAIEADWAAFSKRVYEKQYREFYEKLYYAGGRKPSSRMYKKTRQKRLKIFMEEAMEYLTAGGVGGATDCDAPGIAAGQFRKMMIDYADYRLQMKLSRCDFGTIEKRGGLVLKNKHLMSVFASLFRDFEKTYQDDLYAAIMKKITMKQLAIIKKMSKSAREQLAYAQNDNFTKIWPDKSTRDGIICKIVGQVKKEFQDKKMLKASN